MRKAHLTVPASEFSGYSSIESSPFSEDSPSKPVSFYIKEYQKLYKLLTLRGHTRTNTVKINEDENFQSPVRVNQSHALWGSDSVLMNSKSLMIIGDTSNTSDVGDLTPRNLEFSYSPNQVLPSAKRDDLIYMSIENLKNIISKCGKLPLNIQKAVDLLIEKSNQIDKDSLQEEIIEAALAIEITKEKIINYLISQNETLSFFENIIFASEKTAVELADRSRDDMVNLMKKKASIFEGNFSGKRKIQELYMFAIEIEKWKQGKLNPNSKYANWHPFQNQYEEILKQLKNQLEAQKGKKSGPNLSLQMANIKKKLNGMKTMNAELKKVVDYDLYLWKQFVGEKFKEFQKTRGTFDNKALADENSSLKIELYDLYEKSEDLYKAKEELQKELEKCKQIINDLSNQAVQLKLDTQKDEEINYYLLKIESQDSLISKLEKKIESLKDCLSNRLPIISSEIHTLKNAAREMKGDLVKETRNLNSNYQNGTRIISIFLRKAIDENNQIKIANTNLNGLYGSQKREAGLWKKENEELKLSLLKTSKTKSKMHISLKNVLGITERMKLNFNEIRNFQRMQLKANTEYMLLIKAKINEFICDNKEKVEILRQSHSLQYHQSKLSVYQKVCKIKESISESKSTILAMKSEYSSKINEFKTHFNKIASIVIDQIKSQSIKISEEIEILKSNLIDSTAIDNLKESNNELKKELSKVQNLKESEIQQMANEMKNIENNLNQSLKNRENEINKLEAENSELKIELLNYQEENAKIVKLISEEKQKIEKNLNIFIKNKEDEIKECQIKYEQLKIQDNENKKLIGIIEAENSKVISQLTEKQTQNEKLIEENDCLVEEAFENERKIQKILMEKVKQEENLNVIIKNKEAEIISYREQSESLRKEVSKLQVEKERDKELYAVECRKLEESNIKSVKSKENEIATLEEEIISKKNENIKLLAKVSKVTNESVILDNKLKELKRYFSDIKVSLNLEIHNNLAAMQNLLQTVISEKISLSERCNQQKILTAVENEKTQYKILEKANKDCLDKLTNELNTSNSERTKLSGENLKLQEDMKKITESNIHNFRKLKNFIDPLLKNLKASNFQNKQSIMSLQMEIVDSFKIFKEKLYRKVNEKTIKELETLDEVVELEKIVKAENFQFKESTVIPQLTEIMENLIKENNSLIDNFESKNITMKDFRRNFVENVSNFYILVNQALNDYSLKMVKEKEDLVSKINEIKTYYEIKLKEILRGGKSAIMVLNNGAAVIQKWMRRWKLRRTFDQYMNLIRMEPSKLLEMVDPGLVPKYGNHPNLRKCFRFAGEGWPPGILFNPSMLEEESEEENANESK